MYGGGRCCFYWERRHVCISRREEVCKLRVTSWFDTGEKSILLLDFIDRKTGQDKISARYDKAGTLDFKVE